MWASKSCSLLHLLRSRLVAVNLGFIVALCSAESAPQRVGRVWSNQLHECLEFLHRCLAVFVGVDHLLGHERQGGAAVDEIIGSYHFLLSVLLRCNLDLLQRHG